MDADIFILLSKYNRVIVIQKYRNKFCLLRIIQINSVYDFIHQIVIIIEKIM